MITIDTILENLFCNDENSPQSQNYTENIEIDEEFCDSAKEFLEQQIEQYPYFTLARALLAMLGNQQDRFSGELATFAWAVSYPNVLLKKIYITAVAETGEETIMDSVSTEKVSDSLLKSESRPMLEFSSETAFEPVRDPVFDPVFDPVEAYINNPTIISVPKEFQWTHDTQEGEDISAQFSTLSDEICTETLARIYLSQGNFRNAREIYIRLSLKNPEKSVYFAELISQIDNSYFN